VNLILDIGNTHTKAACFDDAKLTEYIRLKNNDIEGLVDWMQKYDFAGAIYCDVGGTDSGVPEALGRCCTRVIRLDHLTPLPFRVLYRNRESLGHDRIAAAAGAYDRYPGKNVAIFDFGTAITIDFINGRGEYLGGNISPGMSVRFRSLHDYTAGLPWVEKDAAFPPFGDDTRSALVAGVQQGIVHEIMGYIQDFKKRYSPCEFMATGGDASFFAPYLTLPLTMDPWLVLKGLHAILAYNDRLHG